MPKATLTLLALTCLSSALGQDCTNCTLGTASLLTSAAPSGCGCTMSEQGVWSGCGTGALSDGTVAAVQTICEAAGCAFPEELTDANICTLAASGGGGGDGGGGGGDGGGGDGDWDEDAFTCEERQKCVALGGACKINDQCSGPHVAVDCVNQKCVQNLGFGATCREDGLSCRGRLGCVKVSDTEARCLVPTFAGGDCVDNLDCSTLLAKCTNGKCDGASENEACQQDGDCKVGLGCDYSSEKCAQQSWPGESCASRECVDLSQCIGGSCVAYFSQDNGFDAKGQRRVCKSSYTNSDGVCAVYPKSMIDDTSSCDKNNDCTNSNSCHCEGASGKCENEGYESPSLLNEQIRHTACALSVLKTCHRNSVCFFQQCPYEYDLEEVFKYIGATEDWCYGTKETWIETYRSVFSQLSRVQGAGARQTLSPSSTEREVIVTIKVKGLAVNEETRLAIIEDITAYLSQSPASVTLTAGADGQTVVKIVFLSGGTASANELADKMKALTPEKYEAMFVKTKAANPDVAVENVEAPVIESTSSATALPFLGVFTMALALLF